ncbi:hypothetical protein [Aquabacterium sp.]|uniref:hypothetical protein n=1 Tax=Aquabacterium sp. TaxID=1872578 RepID=UPI002E35CD4D|nr:hypothetical protein [Aquabacterium sp.]HEX5310550.1 hypothetical protein [Aquabacterium sp.]
MKYLALIFIVFSIAGCGGSGSNEADSTYFGVTGVKDGSSYTVCIKDMEYVDPGSDSGKAVTANLVAYYKLTGEIKSLSGTGQTCQEKFPQAATSITVAFYNDNVRGASVSSDNSDSGGQNNGGNSTSITYFQWQGSVNGAGVRDSSGKVFGFRASDGQMFYWPGGGVETKLNGLSLSGINLMNNGRAIGGVYLSAAAGGGKLAVLYCSDGSLMAIDIDASGWSYQCNGVGGGSGTITGGTGGNQNGGQTSTSYITWLNSSNGENVMDASGDAFKFNSQTKCLYSLNRQTEYSNACLSTTGYGYLGYFDGTPVYVVLARAQNGTSCVAVFTDSNYYAVDIYTDNTKEYFSSTNEKWQPC